ncbi:hypothetical protein ACFE04_008188 [Oxalis oulophora]
MKYAKLSFVVESAGTVKSIKADHTSANRDMICNEAFAPPSVMERKEDECEHEISRRAALGLTCKCKNSHSFWPASVEGYLGVDVYGFLGPRGYKIYSIQQTEKSRNQFRPLAMLQFLSSSAVMHGPVYTKAHRDVDWLKDVATVLAYRKAVFSGAKDTSILGSEQQPIDLDVIEDLDQQEKVPSPWKFELKVGLWSVIRVIIAVGDEQVVIDSHPCKMSRARVSFGAARSSNPIQRNNLGRP